MREEPRTPDKFQNQSQQISQSQSRNEAKEEERRRLFETKVNPKQSERRRFEVNHHNKPEK